MTPGTGGTRLRVAVLTFRRPDDLSRVLPALVEQAADVADLVGDCRVLVVDNDPAAGAERAVRSWADRGVDYVHEPEPGIAAARNRALASSAADDLLVFVDDDEEPHAGWLRALLESRRRTGAAAVAGAVVSAYDGEPTPWLAAGDFFRRRQLPEDTPITVAATNNLLLDMHVVRRLGLRFDAAFGISGGSDTLFTRRLTDAGELMVWSAAAVVTDWVPVGRLTRDWVLRRALRLGNSTSRVDVLLAGGPAARLGVRLRATARGAVRLLGGCARWAVGVATGSLRHRARGLRTAARGLGMTTGAWGHVYQEYRRRS